MEDQDHDKVVISEALSKFAGAVKYHEIGNGSIPLPDSDKPSPHNAQNGFVPLADPVEPARIRSYHVTAETIHRLEVAGQRAPLSGWVGIFFGAFLGSLTSGIIDLLHYFSIEREINIALEEKTITFENLAKLTDLRLESVVAPGVCLFFLTLTVILSFIRHQEKDCKETVQDIVDEVCKKTKPRESKLFNRITSIFFRHR